MPAPHALAELSLDALSCYEERCRCGHLRGQHELWLEVRGDRVAFIRGGGTCSCGACLCERFDFDGLEFLAKN